MPGSRHGRQFLAAKHPGHNAGEGHLELLVGHHVDDGVERGVEVANPEENSHGNVWTRTIVTTDGHRQIPREEGKPAQEESSHHNSKSYKSLEKKYIVR